MKKLAPGPSDQVHVFCKSVKEAFKIRKGLVEEILQSPNEYFENPSELVKCHTSANSQLERELVERDWRNGVLRIVVSTDTLLVVLNLSLLQCYLTSQNEPNRMKFPPIIPLPSPHT